MFKGLFFLLKQHTLDKLDLIYLDNIHIYDYKPL